MPTMFLNSLFRWHKCPLNRSKPVPLRPRLQLEVLEWRNLLSGGPPINANTDTEGVFHAETTIAVNPTNPLNMIGSASDVQVSFDSQGQVQVTNYAHAHVTFDGGQNWTEYSIPFNQKKYTIAGDPAVAFDVDGTAYLSTGGFTVLPNGDVTGDDILWPTQRTAARSGPTLRPWPPVPGRYSTVA